MSWAWSCCPSPPALPALPRAQAPARQVVPGHPPCPSIAKAQWIPLDWHRGSQAQGRVWAEPAVTQAWDPQSHLPGQLRPPEPAGRAQRSPATRHHMPARGKGPLLWTRAGDKQQLSHASAGPCSVLTTCPAEPTLSAPRPPHLWGGTVEAEHQAVERTQPGWCPPGVTLGRLPRALQSSWAGSPALMPDATDDSHTWPWQAPGGRSHPDTCAQRPGRAAGQRPSQLPGIAAAQGHLRGPRAHRPRQSLEAPPWESVATGPCFGTPMAAPPADAALLLCSCVTSASPPHSPRWGPAPCSPSPGTTGNRPEDPLSTGHSRLCPPPGDGQAITPSVSPG